MAVRHARKYYWTLDASLPLPASDSARTRFAAVAAGSSVTEETLLCSGRLASLTRSVLVALAVAVALAAPPIAPKMACHASWCAS
jgi:hypothetical protein